MRIDYTIQPFQLAIGGFNVTAYLDLLKLTQGAADQGKSLTWTGEFELNCNRDAEAAALDLADFDPLTSPTLWRPDQVPVALTLLGYPFPTLRIKNYVFNVQTRTGRGTLYQVLDVVEGDRPAEEVETPIGTNGTALTEVAQKLLETAFAGATLNPTLSLGSLTGTLDTRLTTRDPLNDAQKIVATNYRWLWADNQEQVRTVSGDPSANPVLFQRSLNQVEWDPDLDAINFAAEKIIVTGQHQVAGPNTVKIVEIHTPAEKTHDDDGRQIKLVVPTYKKKADLYPDIYRDAKGKPTDTTDVLAELKTVQYHYYGIHTDFETLPAIQVDDGSGNQIAQYFPALESLGYQFGDLVETVTTYERTLGQYFTDQNFKSQANTTLFVAEKLVERDYCKINYQARGIINPDAYPEDTSLELVTAEPIKSGRVNPDGAVNNQLDKRDGGPLKLEKGYRREFTFTSGDVAMETENLRGECTLRPVGWTPFRQKPLVEDFGFLPSQAHADYLARQIGLREVRRRDAIAITMPLPVEWLAAGCPPLHRCQIHNAELQIEAPILTISDGQMSLHFTGSKIGTIPPIPDPPSPSPYVPVAGLTIAPVASIRATVGVAV